jgi:formamidopyrimidine-DNA glycosylase
VPELPEVETTRRYLAAHLPGARVAAVALLDPRVLVQPDPATFAAQLAGRTLTAVRRRGKYLILDLAPAPPPADAPAPAPAARHLVVHRRMTGNLFLRAPGAPPDAHTVAVFHLTDGRELRLCDLRRLARLWLADAADLAALDRALGPEPLTPTFTPERLAASLARRRARLKPLLLDQRLVAGLGNIYADEALFAAGLHPARPAHTLTPEEIARLHAAIRAVLEQGIHNEGTSFRDYRGAVGQPGRNQLLVAVFRRTGQPCPRCGTPIVKTRIGGRGTHYCPQCQR